MVSQAFSYVAPGAQSVKLDIMVHVSSALKKTVYNFKNAFSSYFVFIKRAKYSFMDGIFPLILKIDLTQGVRAIYITILMQGSKS